MALSVDAMIRTHMQVKVDIMCLLLPLAFLPSCDCTVILPDFVLRQKIHVFESNIRVNYYLFWANDFALK